MCAEVCPSSSSQPESHSGDKIAKLSEVLKEIKWAVEGHTSAHMGECTLCDGYLSKILDTLQELRDPARMARDCITGIAIPPTQVIQVEPGTGTVYSLTIQGFHNYCSASTYAP